MRSLKLKVVSIDYTNIMKCYIQNKEYKKALDFFNTIKSNTDLIGMRITYNYALNLYTYLKDYK